MTGAELLVLVRAMTPGPWRQEPAWNNGGCPTADFHIPGHNQGASVEMLAGDAAAIVALANHAAPLVELVQACDRLANYDGSSTIEEDRDDWSAFRAALASVYAVRGDVAIPAPIEQPRAEPHPCTNTSPRWFTGRWLDWHRGHGCDLDDGKPRTAAGEAEIRAGGRTP